MTLGTARLLRRTPFDGRLAVTEALGFALVASRQGVQVGATRRSVTITLAVKGIVCVGVNGPKFWLPRERTDVSVPNVNPNVNDPKFWPPA